MSTGGSATREDRILAAATRLFRARPYEDVSLDAIADEAGVARGLINHYFGTKRGVYLEVVREVTSVESFPVPDYVQGATPRARLLESLDAWLDLIERDREVWEMSLRAATSMGDGEIAAIIEEAREETARRLVAVLGLGPVGEIADETLATVRAWAGFGEAVVVQWLQYDRITREQAHDLIVDTIMPGVERLTADVARA
ncbi:TetR/AcrR family transcriptional regulator [Svornostia abyssi]|uniref:TetR/AcrR family transcriptional regulator n=1 Tax=Svornostia abyssi TaxID=2898438 RepID=A0ABY5PHU4_9ACTN|nr:TetR/AcrR family transcriptional regulator [Parviterribacteraceae bacterium J379]